MKMTRFRSRHLNNVHFVTTVTFKRLPIFRSEEACKIFVNVLDELRKTHKLRVSGYVIMPDHVHLLLNLAVVVPRCPAHRLGRCPERMHPGRAGVSRRAGLQWRLQLADIHGDFE